MQISRRTLLACATAAVLLPLGAFSGQDNPAQTKARQALDRMMQGLPPQPATQIQIPPAAATNRPVPVQPTPSMPMYPAPAPPPAMVPGTKTPPPPTAAKAKALEDALQQKMKETEEPQPAPPPPMAVPPAPAPQNPPSTQGGYTQPRPPIQPWLATPPPSPQPPPPQPAPPPPQPAPPPAQIAPPPPQPMPSPEPVKAAPAFSKEEASGPEYQNVVLPKGSSPEDIQRAREALHETMPGVAEQANTPVFVVVPGEAAPPAGSTPSPGEKAKMQEPSAMGAGNTQNVEKPKAAKNLSQMPPLQGPPSPLPASKEQRLQDLLQLYRMDRISPEEYHMQRAKILAEP